MDLEVIRGLAFKHLSSRKAHHNREQGFIYYHGQRVAKLAVNLRKLLLPDEISFDQEMIVASYFHDVAKGIEPHSKFGSVLARELLADYCTSEELGRIATIIGHHQLRQIPNDYPDCVKIVQDADILDHFGSVEIWMNFQYYAHAGGTIDDSIAFYRDDYTAHAQGVRELLNYPVSVQIFDQKDTFVREFVTRMALEAEGGFIL